MNTCLHCGKPLLAFQKTFCSHSCHKNYEAEQYIIRWKEGKESGLRGTYQLSTIVRQYLLKQAGYKCSKCGWGKINPSTGKVPLEIDHIDGNYQNNSPENLQVLCPNCHALTPTFKALNKGCGRQERKKLL